MQLILELLLLRCCCCLCYWSCSVWPCVRLDNGNRCELLWGGERCFWPSQRERKPQKRPNKESQRNERAHAKRSLPGCNTVFSSVFAFASAFAFECGKARAAFACIFTQSKSCFNLVLPLSQRVSRVSVFEWVTVWLSHSLSLFLSLVSCCALFLSLVDFHS